MRREKSEKARFLSFLIEQSYDLSFVISDADAIYLSELIQKEKNEELKEALIELDYFLCNY